MTTTALRPLMAYAVEVRAVRRLSPSFLRITFAGACLADFAPCAPRDLRIKLLIPADGHPLPEPVDVDPAALGDDELARRGIQRLPTTLRESVDAFRADPVLSAAFGAALAGAVLAVRESELEQLADATPEEVADASRWAH